MKMMTFFLNIHKVFTVFFYLICLPPEIWFPFPNGFEPARKFKILEK